MNRDAGRSWTAIPRPIDNRYPSSRRMRFALKTPSVAEQGLNPAFVYRACRIVCLVACHPTLDLNLTN